MRESTHTTKWICDRCQTAIELTDIHQETPPVGWRRINVLTPYVNLALEGDVVKRLVLCAKCFEWIP